jgi:hypothetical protein
MWEGWHREGPLIPIIDPKQPLVAGNRNGEKCRGTRRPADPDMTAVGVLIKIAHTGVDLGSVCTVSFHGSLWHTEIFAKLFACISVTITGARSKALFYRGRAS